MWATVKTRYVCVQIKGVIPGAVLDALRQEYGRRLILRSEQGERMTDILNADLYRRGPEEMTPGEYLKRYRQDKDLTQAELGQKLGGVARQNVSGMENDRRQISRKMALRLSEFFGVTPGGFLARGA